MTLIGKLLVFLVLLLALVWNALVVNAYATRTNWKKQADTYQAKATEAAESAGNLRKLVDAERESAEDQARVLREDRDRLYQQLLTTKRSYDEISKAYQDRQTADKTNNVQANQLQANLDTTQKQLADLTKLQAEKESQIDQLTLRSEQAKAGQVAAELRADAQQRRAEQLNERYNQLRDQLAQSKQVGDGGGLGALNPKPVAPGSFRGTVRTRSGDLVAFTPGSDAGLRVGTVLTVRRLTPTPKFVGKVRVTVVDPKEAVGQFTPPANGVRLSPADYPQAGDELVPD